MEVTYEKVNYMLLENQLMVGAATVAGVEEGTLHEVQVKLESVEIDMAVGDIEVRKFGNPLDHVFDALGKVSQEEWLVDAPPWQPADLDEATFTEALNIWRDLDIVHVGTCVAFKSFAAAQEIS